MSHSNLLCIFLLLASLEVYPVLGSTAQLGYQENVLVGLVGTINMGGFNIPIFEHLNQEREAAADNGGMVWKIRILRKKEGFIRMLRSLTNDQY